MWDTQMDFRGDGSQRKNIQLPPSILDKLLNLFLGGGISEVSNKDLRLSVWPRFRL